MKGKYTDLMFSDKLSLICRLFSSRGHFCNFVQFLSTAQVPDDEQFVPDFQSENCEYLKIYNLFSFDDVFGGSPEKSSYYSYLSQI